MGDKSNNKNEVIGIIIFAISILIFLMYYLPNSGIFGMIIKNIGFGLIGQAAIIIPFFLLYAAIDFFLEKREGVSNHRVLYVVLFLTILSALLFTLTVDYSFFRSLCVSAKKPDSFSAFKAMSLLFKSGPDSSIISNTTNNSNVISGGFLGGLISLGLLSITNKPITVLLLITFLFTQIILVFRISIKKTYKKAISTVRRAANSTSRPQRNMNQSPFVSPSMPTRDVGLDVEYNKYDPFLSTVKVDPKSGFMDVSDKEYGADLTYDDGYLSFEERRVSTKVPHNEESDFSFTASPKIPPVMPIKKDNSYKFPGTRSDAQKDFFDVPSDFTIQHDKQISDYDEDDLPEEIIDAPQDLVQELPSEPSESYEDQFTIDKSEPTRRIRQPIVDINPESNDQIINNSSDDDIGFSRTEGRVIANAEEVRATGDSGVNFASTSTIRNKPFKPAPTSCIKAEVKGTINKEDKMKLKQKGARLVATLESFGISTEVVNITHGPSITRFELAFKSKGIKVSRVLSLQDDIALSMAAFSVRIEAPIPGKSAIGVEIPNDQATAVNLRSLLETPEARKANKLEVPIGRDIPGRPIMCDIARMPHLLIAGSTGSGKSVCINTILTSILCHATPDDVRMILIDPKVVELTIYNGIPHLYMPVVTEPKKAANALQWAVIEMEKRYNYFAETSVRDLKGYNEYLMRNGQKPLPMVLIVIDELADLMAVASKEVEDKIARLAAMARAAGIHLLIATQRPSTDVITGLIKSNIPSRIAFAVSSNVDSRVILDGAGAEKLLGRGDMLYSPLSAPKPIRGQGAFLSDADVENVVKYYKSNYNTLYDSNIIAAVNNGFEDGNNSIGAAKSSSSGELGDELFDEAVSIVIQAKNASVSILQRRLGIGYPRAARLIDLLEKRSIIGPFEGSKPRKVLITETEWLEMKARGTF